MDSARFVHGGEHLFLFREHDRPSQLIDGVAQLHQCLFRDEAQFVPSFLVPSHSEVLDEQDLKLGYGPLLHACPGMRRCRNVFHFDPLLGVPRLKDGFEVVAEEHPHDALKECLAVYLVEIRQGIDDS